MALNVHIRKAQINVVLMSAFLLFVSVALFMHYTWEKNLQVSGAPRRRTTRIIAHSHT